MNPSDYVYFIITKKPENPLHIKLGSICYTREFTYNTHNVSQPGRRTKLPVTFLKSLNNLMYNIDVIYMEKLSLEEADFLLACEPEDERLHRFRDNAFQASLGLTVGTNVMVKEQDEMLMGVIRYIGPILEPDYVNPIRGRFFGIELQKQDKGKGKTDGSYGSKTFFLCEKNCGIFAPFSRVKPLVPTPVSPSMAQFHSQQQAQNIFPGDNVYFFIDDKYRYGIVLDIQEDGGQHIVQISTDKDENGKRGGEIKLPLYMVNKGECLSGSRSMDIDIPPVEAHTDLSISLNSVVEVTLGKGNSYGIIRWIGRLPGREDMMVGLELEEACGVSDGTIHGKRYFDCPPKRALFVKLISCRPDSRFQNISAQNNMMLELDKNEEDGNHDTRKLETVPPISTEQVEKLLIGRMKGIQGHCNSCYMDSALFGLFSCSSVLDSMLFKATTPQDAPIQKILLHDIVNPLRSKGFVHGRHIMRFREQLQKHGYCQSFTTDEKDPEEFLIIVMHHILVLEPLLKLSAAGKVQESYCYQIFLDQNHSLVLPTVQQLLEHSFHSGGLKLAEVPSCLILQMPRFGKKFKMFSKIIPSLELDITDLLSEGPQQCIMCGHMAVEECADCFKEPVFSQTGFKVFCKTCSTQVHSHPQRLSHQPAALEVPKGYIDRGIPHSLTRDRLELFAVLCIETSHYVSFVKHGPNTRDWIFFDSMADREGERDGFNIPEVQACPEVGMYLEMSPAELANQVPRDMKGVAKRLFCDAYMYLYRSTSMCLYR
ncbi:ubiquitin carboxyl-terminal hydrolase CYLD [Xiphophorus hellerii]|uniref:ubiquitin carboxyl-terminal hydrolase CYLD n=1 Tax=Xiphophorus hellerii TaxID=8084 RepID=UPI0013B45851|nr:ubiquitin carboxyl-terminal hydrolase CYLD-like [Xiphophorus hellerii]XP_032428785.1 ubiquitin carboxyl-terminal hydrolase CYLD-like [Xiphophorus hellerii]